MPLSSDSRWMRRALALARRGEGHTRPNPPVGAVVVRNGRIIGEGFHRKAGAAHAEVAALSGVKAAGATLYVTLEPCSTTGRTPPCTDLLLAAGLRSVVVGCLDPNPRHAGAGIDILRAGGIAVTVGVEAKACAELIAPFSRRITTGRPYVTLKLGLTLDGRIADRQGRSKWITGPDARLWVQRLRRRADAVMVGAGTVIADDPSLNCRLTGAGETLRVIVDGRGRTPTAAHVLTDACAGRTIVVTTPRGEQALRQRWPAGSSSRVWTFPEAASGLVLLSAVLKRLAAEEGVMHVLCEGGAGLAGSLVREGLVDETLWIYAPRILGDASGMAAVVGADYGLDGMPHFRIEGVRRIGRDLLVRARPESE